LAYQAFTVFGQPFQTVLLAPEISYLTQAGDSTCSNTQSWINPGLSTG
jgi:hypothetical protein